MSDQERLEKIKDKYMEREYDYALSSMDIDWLISTIEEQRRIIKTASSELNYALNSNKSQNVKRFYIENAKRFLDEALEVEG